MNSCPDCGFKSEEKFCGKCGTKMTAPKIEPTTPKVFSHLGTALILDVIYARLKIAFHDKDDILVTISGDEEMKGAVVATKIGNSLSLTGKLPGVDFIPEYNRRIRVAGDSVSICGVTLDKKKILDVEIKLPKNSGIELKSLSFGKVVFLNDGNNFQLSNCGTMEVVANNFRTLIAVLSGGCSMTLSSVYEWCSHTISDGSSLVGESVKFSSFKSSRISDGGSVKLERALGDYSITVCDGGSLSISQPSLDSASFKISDGGSVNISYGEITELRVIASDGGSFVYQGHAQMGYYTATDGGSISAKKTTQVLQKRMSDGGSISA